MIDQKKQLKPWLIEGQSEQDYVIARDRVNKKLDVSIFTVGMLVLNLEAANEQIAKLQRIPTSEGAVTESTPSPTMNGREAFTKARNSAAGRYGDAIRETKPQEVSRYADEDFSCGADWAHELAMAEIQRLQSELTEARKTIEKMKGRTE